MTTVTQPAQLTPEEPGSESTLGRYLLLQRAGGLAHGDDAGPNRLPIQEDGTGATDALAAAVFRAG